MGLTTKQLPPSKLEPGTQLRKVCVHHIGGTGTASLTKRRRESVLRKHRNSLVPGTFRCAEHCKNWKALARCGAVKPRNKGASASHGILVIVKSS